MLNFGESSQVGSVSIRSESTQLPSELITATVVMVIAGPGKTTQPKVIMHISIIILILLNFVR